MFKTRLNLNVLLILKHLNKFNKLKKTKYKYNIEIKFNNNLIRKIKYKYNIEIKFNIFPTGFI